MEEFDCAMISEKGLHSDIALLFSFDFMTSKVATI